jgi:hypothetical protein
LIKINPNIIDAKTSTSGDLPGLPGDILFLDKI